MIGPLVGLGAAAACVALAWRAAWRIGPETDAWTAEVREALGEAKSDEEKVALVDQLLGEFERRIVEGEHWPRAALWLNFAVGFCTLIAEALTSRWAEAAAVLIESAAGAMAALAGGRAMRRMQEQARRQADEIVARLAGELIHREVAIPRRRKLRIRRKPGEKR